MSTNAMKRKKTKEIIVFMCFAVAYTICTDSEKSTTPSPSSRITVSSSSANISDTPSETLHTTSNVTVSSSLPGMVSNYTNQTLAASTDTTENLSDTTSTSATPSENNSNKFILPEALQTYAILGGVGILFLLLIVNLASVVQRRKDHHVIQSYLLSLHTLLPFLRNYADITNVDVENPKGKKSLPPQVFGNNIEEYDEIEIVARRSKQSEAKDAKRGSEADHSKKVDMSEEMTKGETPKDRSNVYSLQKEIFSSNL
ncbi:uncharacterized protein LOC133206237 isoform X1 [Saccostrea echinata]|uniref:uncharacterized protein LOC133206237 isoform X1 n=1 Tax=Saccostrea echinata TaxID=191078 RepID=UPI002A83CE16|nr:uncharacterized protein LOC133206237 isoform X1 [Saccostrea echinata]